MIPREMIQNKGSPDTVATELQVDGQPSEIGRGKGPSGDDSRATMRLEMRAVIAGWMEDPERYKRVRDRMEARAIGAESETVQQRADESLVKLVEVAGRFIEWDDKTDRLDRGEATEITQGVQIVIQRHETPGGELIEGNP